MAAEAVAAVVLGGLVLWIILAPLFRAPAAVPAFLEPLDPEETRRGIALIALKEIDFDRATGKLSEADYESLKAKYTGEALAALREEESPADAVEALIADRVKVLRSSGAAGSMHSCPQCGPRPEPDPKFCSNCGGQLTVMTECRVCHARLEIGSKFCSACGVAA
jgi:hypothetical protein